MPCGQEMRPPHGSSRQLPKRSPWCKRARRTGTRSTIAFRATSRCFRRSHSGPRASTASQLTNRLPTPMLQAPSGSAPPSAHAVEYTYTIDAAMNDANCLIAADAAGVRPSLVAAVYARLIADRQESDGHWETTDVRPPQSYSPVTATAVALRAIQLYAHPSQKADVGTRVARGRSWLLSHQPRATEERVYQLLGAYWAAADAGSLHKMAAGLQATQQADGGWSSLDGRSSDAYSTGEALYAMHEAGGVAITDSAWQRGIAWLLRTQAPDGSWHVASRMHPPAPVSPPYFETGHPYGHDQFISAMGESIAVIALATALGPGKSKRLVLQEAEPRGIEPNRPENAVVRQFRRRKEIARWRLESELRDSSRRGHRFDAGCAGRGEDEAADRSRSQCGCAGEGPLFSAAGGRTISRIPPAAAMNLLLDHGAKVRLPKGQGAPLFNAFPIMLAAYTGNSGMIRRLHNEGDRVDDKMNFLGMFPETPLLALAGSNLTGSVAARAAGRRREGGRSR